MDYNETELRQLPITLNFREVVFTSFSTSFLYNQTSKSIKCNSTEEWAKNWIDVSNMWEPHNSVVCSTNVSSIAYFQWDPYGNNL